VKKFSLLAALVAAMVATTAAVPQARAQVGHPMSQVAILDLTYIFKNHLRFQQLSNDMRRAVDKAEKDLQADREAYRKLAEQMETTYRKGTPEYNAMEEELNKRAADLNLRVNRQKKEFLEQEAKIYFNVYSEVIEHVKYYSESNGINLVLRFNGDPIDRNDPQDVLKELNKSVLYYNRAIDITPLVLEKLNAGAAPAGGGLAPNGGIPGGAPGGMPAGGIPQTGMPGLPPRR
jgi:Skp family chaperone for outer membrane proteins